MIKVFFGKDSGLINRLALNEIQSKKIEPIKYDGYKDTVSDLVNECRSLSLFGEKKTVLFSNAYFLSTTKGNKNPIKEKDQDYKSLLIYFKDPEPDCDLYLLVIGSLDSKNELVKALKELPADFQEVFDLKDDDFLSLASKRAKAVGGDIDREAVKLLNEYCYSDYSLFVNNLDKLLLYNKHVRTDDVKLLVNKPLEDKAYDLASKLLNNNIKSALKSYQELRQNGWDGIALISTLANQFKFMALTKFLISKKYNNDEIASELSSKSSKVKSSKIYYTRKDIQNYSFQQLLNILCRLGDIEKDIKLNNDSVDERIELFFLSFR